MRIVVAALAAVLVTGCATVTPVPSKRPLTQAHIETMGPTRVSVTENTNGVGKSWFMSDSSQAGAQHGLIGALVSATIDAIKNAGPSRRANKAANEMAALISTDSLNQGLVEELKRNIPQGAPPSGVSFSDVTMTEAITNPDAQDDVIRVTSNYTLSEDASVLRINYYVYYESEATPYTTPYTFEGEVPEHQTKGAAYTNTFVYYSDPLPVPTLTPELRERLTASIKESAKDDNGQPPAKDSTEFKAMQKELEDAEDDKLTEGEIAIFLTREWLKDGGARIREEVRKANIFAAKYALIDLNSTAVPAMDGVDELIETLPDSRTVRRTGAGYEAGSYVSSAGNLSAFATYGNAVAYGRENNERTAKLHEEARERAKAKAKAKS